MNHRFCMIVPHYCHAEQLAAFLPKLAGVGLPVIVVDDGSDTTTRTRLRDLVAPHEDWATLFLRDSNGGKGAAVMTGMDIAERRGFTHMVCVDADGQHDVAAIPGLLRESQRHPHRLLSGRPVFGDDIPLARLRGRAVTNSLARIEAGTRDIEDAMCGLRLYPLAQVRPLCAPIGKRCRMEFDTEILVRACWAGLQVGFLPVRVTYPATGRSHFRMVADNARLSWMHTVLLGTALCRRLGQWVRRFPGSEGRRKSRKPVS